MRLIVIFFIFVIGLYFLNSCVYCITMVPPENPISDVVDAKTPSIPVD